ncbi:MAG: hypothetical protein WCW77_02990 [Patescibacteria group bacterium]|jgi:hypothetical protein
MKPTEKKALFWDTDKINAVKNKVFVIRRILDAGDLDDFRWARKFYGLEAIKSLVPGSGAVLNKKSFSFWCQYFNIDKNKCLKKQSARKQGAFWKRLPGAV